MSISFNTVNLIIRLNLFSEIETESQKTRDGMGFSFNLNVFVAVVCLIVCF